MYASWKDHPDVVKTLLIPRLAWQGNRRVVNINARDEDGQTALMYASWHGHLEVVRELLTFARLWDIGVDVNAKDDRGETALSYASRFGYQDIVRLLKEAGAR